MGVVDRDGGDKDKAESQDGDCIEAGSVARSWGLVLGHVGNKSGLIEHRACEIEGCKGKNDLLERCMRIVNEKKRLVHVRFRCCFRCLLCKRPNRNLQI